MTTCGEAWGSGALLVVCEEAWRHKDLHHGKFGKSIDVMWVDPPCDLLRVDDGTVFLSRDLLVPKVALSVAEDEAMILLCDFVNLMSKEIVGSGPTRNGDLVEIVFHVHALQQKLMSNAFARANPDRFRVLGGTVGGG